MLLPDEIAALADADQFEARTYNKYRQWLRSEHPLANLRVEYMARLLEGDEDIRYAPPWALTMLGDLATVTMRKFAARYLDESRG
jgi:hypothetical protein